MLTGTRSWAVLSKSPKTRISLSLSGVLTWLRSTKTTSTLSKVRLESAKMVLTIDCNGMTNNLTLTYVPLRSLSYSITCSRAWRINQTWNNHSLRRTSRFTAQFYPKKLPQSMLLASKPRSSKRNKCGFNLKWRKPSLKRKRLLISLRLIIWK